MVFLNRSSNFCTNAIVGLSVFGITLFAEDPNSNSLDSAKRLFDINVDFLYFYTAESNDYAFIKNWENAESVNSGSVDYRLFDYDWAPGFRVALGFDTGLNHFDSHFSYTWFQSKSKEIATGVVTPSFFASRLSGLEPFGKEQVSTNLHYNIFDWDLGQMFSASPHLLTRPYLGLKGGWIKQDFHCYLSQSLSSLSFLDSAGREMIEQIFRGGGPKVGLELKFVLGDYTKSYFSLLGQYECAFLWGNWTIKDEFKDPIGSEIFLRTSNRNFGSLTMSSFLGFSYDALINHSNTKFRIKIGYEIENWFNQLQIFTDISGAQSNNLFLQGLSAGLNLDF